MTTPIVIQTVIRGYMAHIVIDSVLNGSSSGGMRLCGDVDLEEVRALAREMTMKFNFIGLKRGGAKSGIGIGDLPKQEKLEIMGEFGRAIRPLIDKGLYYPWTDMDCDAEDLAALYRGACHYVAKFTDSSLFTAISVENAIRACVAGSDAPVDVAIEGLGSVGSYLAARLPEDRFRIVAVSTVRGGVWKEDGIPAKRLGEVRKAYGDDLVHHLGGGTPISHDELFRLPVGLLVPGARTRVIHSGNFRQVRAKYVVPAANAPYADDIIDGLHERGIVCLPGFVANSGGVYGSSLHDRGVPMERIEEVSRMQFRRLVEALLRKSAELRKSPVRVAEAVAGKRLVRNLAEEERSSRTVRIYETMFRRGLIPKAVSSGRALESFSRSLDETLSLVEELADVAG